MDILSYLSELLQTRKTIGIEGLGTLYKKKKPGRYDAQTHSFIPPSYKLDFTSEIKEEIVLPNYISKNRRISVESSIYFINEFSTAILQQLNDHQEASLGNLGKLLKFNGELKFEPTDQSSYGFDFYGLPAINITTELPPLAEELIPINEPTLESIIADNEILEENPGDDKVSVDEVVVEELDVQDKKDEKQLRAEIEALNFYRSRAPEEKPGAQPFEMIWELNDPKVETDKPAVPLSAADTVDPIVVFHPEHEEVKSNNSLIKILLYIVILILIVVAAYFINPDWFKGIMGQAPVAQKTVKSTHIREVYPNPDTSKITDTTEKQLAPVVAVPKDTLITTAPAQLKDTAATYEIIGASMHDQKEADNFIKLMSKSGIKAKVVTHMSGKRLKISIATLKDEKSAKLELQKLAEKLKIPGIYIYRNKQ